MPSNTSISRLRKRIAAVKDDPHLIFNADGSPKSRDELQRMLGYYRDLTVSKKRRRTVREMLASYQKQITVMMSADKSRQDDLIREASHTRHGKWCSDVDRASIQEFRARLITRFFRSSVRGRSLSVWHMLRADGSLRSSNKEICFALLVIPKRAKFLQLVVDIIASPLTVTKYLASQVYKKAAWYWL